MLLLEWLLFIVTFPFWFPVLVFIIGFSILAFGLLVLIFSFLSFCLFIWIFKVFHVTYTGLIRARQDILQDMQTLFAVWERTSMKLSGACRPRRRAKRSALSNQKF